MSYFSLCLCDLNVQPGVTEAFINFSGILNWPNFQNKNELCREHCIRMY